MTKLIFIFLVTSLVILQTPTCEASFFIFNFIERFLAVKDFIGSGLDLIKWVSPPANVEDNTSKLLKEMSKNMRELREALKGNFTAILGRIDKVPNMILEGTNKISFQETVDKIGDDFKSLARKQVKTNKNIEWISNSEASIVANLETDLYTSWKKFQHDLFDGKILSYLKRKESNDVCETGISHLQLLERLLGLYMTVANQYMFSQHIIYNIRQHTDKQSKDDDREEFNNNLENELRDDVETFKAAMRNVSTEYWLCDPDQNTNKTNFIPRMYSECREGSSGSDCLNLQNSGYQCLTNTHKNCECCKNIIAVDLGMAKADAGYVITGVQINIDDHLLYISAKQAKLLPNGQIDISTIRPVREEIRGKQYEQFYFKTSMMHFGNVVIPPNRYMTAVGFQKYKGEDIFYIGAISTKYDSVKKQLIPSDTKREQYNTGGLSNNGTKFGRVVEKNWKGLYGFTDRIQPLIDTRVVESSFPSPLSGVGLFLRGQSEKDGYLAIKINTYNNVPLIPEIPSLDEYPIQKALESLSDSASLHDLEKRFEKL